MDYLNKKSYLVLILLISIFGSIKTQNQAKTDENRPYKFGFNIEGQQHRQEEKDEKGLVTGEFGFITADGVYHVTVYATDEQGRFKILSMKSIKVSPPLDGSPDYSNTPIQNINNNAVQAAIPQSSTTNPPISTISNFLSNQDYSSSKLPENRPTITLQKPMNSCSSCSIPTTTKLPPPIAPQLPQQPGHSQLGLPNQIEVPKPINNQGPPPNINYPQSLPVYPNYPQQNPNQTPVAAFSPSQTPNQNYPQSQPINPVYTQNYPNELSVPNVPANPPSQELIAPFTPNELLPPDSNQNVQSLPEINPFRPDGVPNNNFNSQPDPPNQQFPSPFNPNNDNNYYTQSNPPSQELVSPFLPNNDNNYNQNPSIGNEGIPAPFVPGDGNPYNEPNVSVPPELNISPLPPGGFVDNNYDLQPFNPTITTTISYNYQTTRKPSPIIPEGLHFPGLIHPPSDPPPGENPTMSGPMPPGVTVDDMRDLMYKFNYTVGFHGHYEVGYRSGVKIGAYFVNDRDGYSRIVEYTADELGFHPKVYYIYLGLDHPDIPKEETEKDYGLKGYIFEWYSIG